MREFQRGALTDLDARRQAIHDRSLRGTDQARRAFGVVIRLQVEAQDDSHARSSGNRALHIDQPIVRLEDSLVHIVAHGRLDLMDALFAARFLEIHFGECYVKRGWRLADKPLYFIPVFGLGGELVTRNDGPFA
jgi:hypothetical protein